MLSHSSPSLRDRRILPADLNAARRGDLRAFNRLVSDLQDAIYTLSYRALGNERDAADAAQATFLRAAQNIGRFRAGLFHLWLLRWAVWVCQERLRGSGLDRGAPGRAGGPSQHQALQAGLASLPPDLRLAIILVDVTGLDYAEAAAVLGTSREQVGHSVADARQRLAAHCAEY